MGRMSKKFAPPVSSESSVASKRGALSEWTLGGENILYAGTLHPPVRLVTRPECEEYAVANTRVAHGTVECTFF